MAPVRLRHPNGVTTIQLDFSKSSVQDLQQEIFAATEILPCLQELKAGYPPRPLAVIPDLPVESLGLQRGEQVVVTKRWSAGLTHSSAPPPQVTASSSALSPFAAMTGMMTMPQGFPPVPFAGSGGANEAGPEYVATSIGYLIHRVVPADDSCLFSAIALIFEQDPSKAQSVRQIVATSIWSDPAKWNEGILGRPRVEYIQKILTPTTRGGALELAILAEHYSTEIACVDVATSRVLRFLPPPARDSGNRAIVLCTDVHYDATSVAPTPDAPDKLHQTVLRRDSASSAPSDQPGRAAEGGSASSGSGPGGYARSKTGARCSGTGGKSRGGAATGGAATSSGGAATGGAAMGGVSTGGASSVGAATGGAGTGGASTGGAATGGASADSGREARPRGEDEDEMLVAAKKLAEALRTKKEDTDAASFDLKCQMCGKGMKGEKEAHEHAEKTGHVAFAEY